MTHVLLPVAVLDGETVSPGLFKALSEVTVTVLGYYEVPDQTPPDQARVQYEDRGNEILEDICADFEHAGGTADYRMVFTHDRATSVNRVAAEVDADATLLVHPTPKIEEVYVAIGAADEVPRVGSVVGDLVGDLDADVFLRYFPDAERATDEADAEQALDELADLLIDAGLSSDRIDTAILEGKRAVGPIVADAEGRGIDLVVISDPAPSIGEFVLGDAEERIGNQLLAPVLVVRRARGDTRESIG